MRRFALLCSLAFFVLSAGSAAATSQPTHHIRASADGVAADLSFVARDQFDGSLRIFVRRHGILTLAAPVARFRCRGSFACNPPFYAGFAPPLHVVDLDGDGEPEVMVELYTGGAHCCFSTVFLRYDGRRYRGVMHVWGNVGYHLARLDENGPELVSADDRFAYEFTSFAQSDFPVQIWRYHHGALTDVTGDYRYAIRNDANQLWHAYLTVRTQPDCDVRGILAAWLADEYRLGLAVEGWKQIETAYRRGDVSAPRVSPFWPAGRNYLSALRHFLVQTGYASRRS
jgi:hypothetical protein